MKYLLLVFKYILKTLLWATTICGISFGTLVFIIGIFAAIVEHDLEYLMLLPGGLFSGIVGIFAFDLEKLISSKWEWKL